MAPWMEEAHWIWYEEEKVNQYVDFSQTFNLSSRHGRVTLYISADSKYAAFVNGVHLEASQFADYPEYKVYDELDITHLVHEGENRLAVIGYFQGQSSSVYRQGRAGILFAVLPEQGEAVYSSRHTLCRESKDYASGNMICYSPQLSFSFCYRTDQYDGWRERKVETEEGWQPAEETGYQPPLFARPIKQLQWQPQCQSKIITQGVFWDIQKDLSAGEKMQRAALAFRDAREMGLPMEPAILPNENGIRITAGQGDGIYLILDLGREEAGVPTWELEMEHDAQILFGFGEHLQDMRVRTSIGSRQFAAVYHARQGRQSFTHYFKRCGCRYVQLHIYAHSCKLYYAGLRPTPYPLTYLPDFNCADELHNQIFAINRRTLELCMHEHYEDCPWREQALYAMDSRNQMLCGYYVFGETAFAQASLRLLAKGMREDGLLELCAPARVSITIPAFSLSFIMAVSENVTYSKDRAFAQEMLPVVTKILKTFAEKTDQTGLIPCFTGDAYWNFYEWQDGLDGAEKNFEKRYDAPLGAFFALALEAAAGLYRYLGEGKQAKRCEQEKQQINQALDSYFWNPESEVYETTIEDGKTNLHFCELTQALMICSGSVPAEKRKVILEKLASPREKLIPATLACMIFKYEALLTEPGRYGRFVKEDIGRIWGSMLYQGASSFWETTRGAQDFERAGSLCHGWSAVPLYFYFRYVLGERLDGTKDTPLVCGLYEAKRKKE